MGKITEFPTAIGNQLKKNRMGIYIVSLVNRLNRFPVHFLAVVKLTDIIPPFCVMRVLDCHPLEFGYYKSNLIIWKFKEVMVCFGIVVNRQRFCYIIDGFKILAEFQITFGTESIAGRKHPSETYTKSILYAVLTEKMAFYSKIFVSLCVDRV